MYCNEFYIQADATWGAQITSFVIDHAYNYVVLWKIILHVEMSSYLPTNNDDQEAR